MIEEALIPAIAYTVACAIGWTLVGWLVVRK
jgi:hypothetical protein